MAAPKAPTEIPVKNSGKETIFVAGFMIPAGETRILPAHLVPAKYRLSTAVAPAAAVEEPVNPIKELIDKTVPEIVEALPSLTDPELDELQALNEQSEAPRKSLTQAIVDEKEVREQTAQAMGELLLKKPEELIPDLAALNDRELATALDLEQNNENREDVVAAIQAQQEARQSKPEK